MCHFLWLIREPTQRSTVLQKKSCILVSKRVTSLTLAISDLSDNENCFRVQDRRVILELVEVNYAANQREEGKDYF